MEPVDQERLIATLTSAYEAQRELRERLEADGVGERVRPSLTALAGGGQDGSPPQATLTLVVGGSRA